MNVNEQYLLIKSFNRLLQKGYSLNEVIILMANIKPKIINKLKKLLNEGFMLSQIFKKMRFKKFVYDYLLIGEKCNKVNEVISLIENEYENYLKLKKQMNKVLLYPIILYTFALICFELIRISLYPIIHSLLGDFGIKQNQTIIFLAFNMLKIIGVVSIIIIFLTNYFKQISNAIPFIKNNRCLIIVKNLIILLTCGNSLNDAMEILQANLNQKIFRIYELKQALFNNHRFTIFSPFTLAFKEYFKLGLKSNELVQTLKDYHDITNELFLEKLTKLAYVIQFFLFTIISINIFLIYYLIMMPLLNISDKL